MANLYPYEPDYAASPGDILAEILEGKKMSQAEFANRCGRSTKLISEIIAGKASVEPQTAMQFERVTGMSAEIWNNIDAAYRLHQARTEEAARLVEAEGWARKFPRPELLRRGYVKDTSVGALLNFFGVGSITAWQDRYGQMALCARHSMAFNSTPESLATWLRIGELLAEPVKTEPFDRHRLTEALRNVRGLTRLPVDQALPEVRTQLAAVGVVFGLVPKFKGVAISGCARWLAPQRAMICQTARGMADDHLWFTFFHEAAHLVLHLGSRKDLIVDQDGRSDDDIEREANEWASDFLVPNAKFVRLLGGLATEAAVRRVADEEGIAAGIVVGMLQHVGAVPWNSGLNALKTRYQWADDASPDARSRNDSE